MQGATEGFAQQVSLIAQQSGHADRVEPFRGYFMRLMLEVRQEHGTDGSASRVHPRALGASATA